MDDSSPTQPGRRIAVVGTSGCGKTHVAKRLAEVLGVPYICNDAIYWGPDWTENPSEKRIAEYKQATSGPAWTFDGNLGGQNDNKGPLVLQRIDTLIWLDLPRWQVFLQVLKRTIRRAWTKEPMWHNNSESWRMSFFSRDSILLWSMKIYSQRKKRYVALFADPEHTHLKRIRFTRRKDVNAWLASLAGESA